MHKKKAAEAANIKNHINDSTAETVKSILTEEPQDRFVLAKRLGISERIFRKAIRSLRLQGVPVCTDPHGGYYLASKSECMMEAKKLRSRAYDLLQTAKALEGQDPEQITFMDILRM